VPQIENRKKKLKILYFNGNQHLFNLETLVFQHFTFFGCTNFSSSIRLFAPAYLSIMNKTYRISTDFYLDQLPDYYKSLPFA
jgi:hypothetical protein